MGSIEEEEDKLFAELRLDNPDIIVCCGTEKAFVDACYKNQELDWKMTSRGIWYFVDNGKVVISFAHPEARVKGCFLHYALLDAVREIRLEGIGSLSASCKLYL